jgi:hypothetical protein
MEIKPMRNGSLLGSLVALASLISGSGAQAQIDDISWAGFILKSANLGQATPPTTFTAVSAKWKQPVVTCPTDNARVSFWVGIDGSGTPTVEQAGTVAVCSAANKPPTYRAFWEMFVPNNKSLGGQNLTISPGDIVEASVNYANGSYELKLADKTSGHSLSTTRACSAGIDCKRGTAEWTVERPASGKYPFAAFGTIEFTNLAVTSSGAAPTASVLNIAKNGKALSVCNAASPPRNARSDPSDPILDLASGIDCKWLASE